MKMGSNRYRVITKSYLYCIRCHTRNTIIRPKGRSRERGHIKTLYCITCKENTPHIEKRDHDFT